MSAIQIQGLRPLKGTVGIQGSKNAVLPMMAAALLRQFGARIRTEGQTAVALGTYPLRPGIADAPDLRGGAALVLAGLAADGLSIIGSCRHIRRGYEDLCRDLGSLGAEICWL